MSHTSNNVAVYLEIGKTRILAGALEWPGWCRGGRDEAAALQSLVDYGPRYAQVLQAAGLSFHAPADVSPLAVVERLEGNTTTDFGAPDVAPSGDALPIDASELHRLEGLLEACWLALDTARQAALGKELRKGSRGGGRELIDIVRHVVDAEASYLARLGGKLPPVFNSVDDPAIRLSPEALKERRLVILDALQAAARGEFPSRGPRGGQRWTPRFFVRRAAWHILDHVWEIEDRVL
jgi:hypothetical protein